MPRDSIEKLKRLGAMPLSFDSNMEGRREHRYV
jgi:hypothetical protein